MSLSFVCVFLEFPLLFVNILHLQQSNILSGIIFAEIVIPSNASEQFFDRIHLFFFASLLIKEVVMVIEDYSLQSTSKAFILQFPTFV